MTFAVAGEFWLKLRTFGGGNQKARYIRERTEASYRQYLGSLNLFFGQLQLKAIHIGHVRSYQLARIERG